MEGLSAIRSISVIKSHKIGNYEKLESDYRFLNGLFLSSSCTKSCVLFLTVCFAALSACSHQPHANTDFFSFCSSPDSWEILNMKLHFFINLIVNCEGKKGLTVKDLRQTLTGDMHAFMEVLTTFLSCLFIRMVVLEDVFCTVTLEGVFFIIFPSLL